MLDSSWGYDIAKNTTSLKISNKRMSFTEDLAIRLQNVQIECADAVRIIRSRDTADALFYCDPPYYNSDCGHYDGYSLEDYTHLLTLLSSIEGKFILSSYPSPVLKEFVKAHGWQQIEIVQNVSVNAKSGVRKSKTEVLTMNFKLDLNEV
jgi:DNA adenine methylase